jgi:hypothetical protein
LHEEDKTTADSHVDESETVFARLDGEERPRLTVNFEYISEKTCDFTIGFRVPQGAVGIVSFGCKAQWNIILALGNAERLLFGIVENVCTSLSKVGVLGCVVNSLYD